MKVIGEVKSKGQIFSFTGISLLFLFILITGLLFFGSCTKINEFTIGQNFAESQTRLQIIDTFKVELSTVLVDSLVTSSTKVALAGSYSDEEFGSVNCSAFFDLSFQTFDNLEELAIYDSAAFVLPYSGYYYGDTLSLMSLGIYQLTENIVPYTGGNLYNTTSFDYSPIALGSVQFYPAPNSADTAIRVPVNDFGEELFGLIKNKDEKVATAEAFNDLLKGFVLSSSVDGNNAILGFSADKENMILKFYYHIDALIPENKEINLTINETNHQFNNVKADFTDSPLRDLKVDHNIIKGAETNNMVFIQGMTGLLAKVQFPTVQNILMETRWKILRVDLIFEPVRTSYDKFKLPESLYIYDTDRENRINSILRDGDGNALLPEFVYDQFYKTDTRYTFDITSFINQELSDNYFDYDHGLMIGLEQNKFLSTLDRLVIEGKNPPVKLRVYYLTY